MNKVAKNTTIFTTVALATFATVSILSPAKKSNADEFDVGVNVSSVISLSTASDSVMMSAPVGGGFTSGNTSAIVLTNSAYGYTLAIEDTDSNTSMTSSGTEDEVSSNYLGSKTEDTLEENTWGFSVDGTKFYAIPKKNNPLILSKAMLPTSDDGATTTLTFGVKTSRYLTSGTYTNRIILTAYTNGVDGNPEGVDPSSNDPEEASDDVPEPYENGEGINENKLVLLTSMQDSHLHQYCTDTYTPTQNASTKAFSRFFDGDQIPRAVVKDKRDNTKYLISKLPDGYCWMSTNLQLDLTANEPLTNKLTDLNTKTSYTPDRTTQTTVPGGWPTQNISYASYITLSYHPQGTLKYLQGGWTQSETPTQDTNEYLWERVGNYYNFFAATAGSATSSVTSTVVEDSICPKGWRLPLATRDTDKPSFYNFGIKSGITTNSSATVNNIVIGKYNYIMTGRFFDHFGSIQVGDPTWYWSANANGADSAFNFYIGTSMVDFQWNEVRSRGHQIRCVAR